MLKITEKVIQCIMSELKNLKEKLNKEDFKKEEKSYAIIIDKIRELDNEFSGIINKLWKEGIINFDQINDFLYSDKKFKTSNIENLSNNKYYPKFSNPENKHKIKINTKCEKGEHKPGDKSCHCNYDYE